MYTLKTLSVLYLQALQRFCFFSTVKVGILSQPPFPVKKKPRQKLPQSLILQAFSDALRILRHAHGYDRWNLWI